MHHDKVIELLLNIGNAVCDHVYASLQTQQLEKLSEIVEDAAEDTIYAIDREVESIIIPMLEKEAPALGGIVLIAEGIGNAEGKLVLPTHSREAEAAVCIIMDPIDGTRGIMYDKRSAFFLAGAAPNQSNEMYLQDIEAAVMVELPTSKAYLSDGLYALKGRGAFGLRRNLLTHQVSKLHFRPSTASTIIGGFAQVARFFPPGKDLLAKIEEELIASLAEIQEGKALLFEDQYISSGGQLYEMLMGHDRFVADLRTALYQQLKGSGTVTGLTCHPYDVCATRIGEEAGIIITDIHGAVLNVPLNLTHSVDWIAYANKHIQQQVEPVLQQILRKFNWIR
jgi:fructose-1,6-bisphosphatase/inositol monophosphatase family enzyme